MKENYKRAGTELEISGQCTVCPIQGLFPEVCALHRKQLMKRNGRGAAMFNYRWTGWGFTLAAGAGVGLAGSVAVLAAVPALGAKAVLGHAVGYQIAGAATATGAGVNAGIHYKRKSNGIYRTSPRPRLGLRNRYARLPYTLSERRGG